MNDLSLVSCSHTHELPAPILWEVLCFLELLEVKL